MIAPFSTSGARDSGPIRLEGTGAPSGAEILRARGAIPNEKLLHPEWLANAAEELTFQFSAIVETREKALEERLDAPLDGLGDVSVDRICHVLKLMEGAQSHGDMRERAQRLARAYREGVEAKTREQLVPQTMDSGKRYALMRIAHEELTEGGDTAGACRLRGDLQALWRTDGSRIRASLNIAAVACDYSSKDPSRQHDFRATYYQLIEATPTVRSLFDKLLDLGGADGLSKANHLLQRALWMDLQSVSSSMDKTRLLQAACSVSYLGQVCRSMTAFARELTDRFGEVGIGVDGMGRSAFESRCAKELIAIADAMTPPRALLERIAVLLMGQHVESRRLHIFYNALHLQVIRWPIVMWTLQDRKESVLQQLKNLIKKHGHSH